MTAGLPAAEDRVPVAVGLGSNLGDRLAALAFAVEELGELLDDLRCSRVYETEPRHVRDQPRFLNMCCVGGTRLPPGDLLERLHAVEGEAGRRRGPTSDGSRYGPRRLDLDLLLYGDRVLRRDGLTVPHPRMTERAFVLLPLGDVAPDWTHPVEDRTVRELAERLPDQGVRPFREPLPASLRRRIVTGDP